jgi:hypothetical protein
MPAGPQVRVSVQMRPERPDGRPIPIVARALIEIGQCAPAAAISRLMARPASKLLWPLTVGDELSRGAAGPHGGRHCGDRQHQRRLRLPRARRHYGPEALIPRATRARGARRRCRRGSRRRPRLGIAGMQQRVHGCNGRGRGRGCSKCGESADQASERALVVAERAVWVLLELQARTARTAPTARSPARHLTKEPVHATRRSPR